MLIDCHVHLGNSFRNEYPGGRMSPSVHQLIDWMDRNGIDIAVLLPLESPKPLRKVPTASIKTSAPSRREIIRQPVRYSVPYSVPWPGRISSGSC